MSNITSLIDCITISREKVLVDGKEVFSCMLPREWIQVVGCLTLRSYLSGAETHFVVGTSACGPEAYQQEYGYIHVLDNDFRPVSVCSCGMEAGDILPLVCYDDPFFYLSFLVCERSLGFNVKLVEMSRPRSANVVSRSECRYHFKKALRGCPVDQCSNVERWGPWKGLLTCIPEETVIYLEQEWRMPNEHGDMSSSEAPGRTMRLDLTPRLMALGVDIGKTIESCSNFGKIFR